MISALKLMLVTHRQAMPLGQYLDFIRRCADGGVTSVQLREKGAELSFLADFGVALQTVLSPYAIPLIINDHVELAAQLGAEGIHLGQSDGEPFKRSFKIVGRSIERMDQLDKANQSDTITYVAASSVFPTSNKSDIKTVWGLEGLKELVPASKHPVVGIGGIDTANIRAVMKTGVAGVAVIGALHKADRPAHAAQQLRELIDAG